MKKKNLVYKESLTKEYLEEIGVTNVTVDGRIFKGEKELKQYANPAGYLIVNLYDQKLYNYIYPVTKDQNSGGITLPVQRIVYAWYYGPVPNDMVIDHIDNDRTNNNRYNLQMLEFGANLWKQREHFTSELRCKERTREYYSDRLALYEERYKELKAAGDQEAMHRLRSNISQYRARLRYWDSHYGTKKV